MKELLLPVFAISRHRMGIDGEGITTLVTTYGCPLRCSFCLNPESWDGNTKVINYTGEQLYEQLKVDHLYFLATGGGVAFGGGEPLLHAAFIQEFKQTCGSEWTITVETSLNVDWQAIEMVLDAVDYFIIDIKDMNPKLYQSYTGNDNIKVIANLSKVLERIDPERITVKVPYIPGYNTKSDMNYSFEALKKMGVTNINRFNYVVRT
jgi:pyruvate formate lyase activating enzyme